MNGYQAIFVSFLLHCTINLSAQKYLMPKQRNFDDIKDIVIRSNKYPTDKILIANDSVIFLSNGIKHAYPLVNVNYISVSQKMYPESLFLGVALIYFPLENFILNNENNMSPRDQVNLRITGLSSTLFFTLFFGRNEKTKIFHINKRLKEEHYFTNKLQYEVKY